MRNRKTCAISKGKDFDGTERGTMCKHCSGVNINYQAKYEYWKCKKYNTRLNEDDNTKWLLRCDECLTHGDE